MCGVDLATTGGGSAGVKTRGGKNFTPSPPRFFFPFRVAPPAPPVSHSHPLLDPTRHPGPRGAATSPHPPPMEPDAGPGPAADSGTPPGAAAAADFFLSNYRLGKTLGIGSFGKVRVCGRGAGASTPFVGRRKGRGSGPVVFGPAPFPRPLATLLSHALTDAASRLVDDEGGRRGRIGARRAAGAARRRLAPHHAPSFFRPGPPDLSTQNAPPHTPLPPSPPRSKSRSTS